jgi:hypothetical protein
MATNKAKHPLRKVIARIQHPEIPSSMVELYECGHYRFPKQDIYGETNANRRRCHKCSLGLPAEIDVSQYQ